MKPWTIQQKEMIGEWLKDSDRKDICPFFLCSPKPCEKCMSFFDLDPGLDCPCSELGIRKVVRIAKEIVK